MGKKKKVEVTEVVEVVEQVDVMPKGISVVKENLGVDPNDPRTRSDR